MDSEKSTLLPSTTSSLLTMLLRRPTVLLVAPLVAVYWMRSFRVASYTEALAQALGLARQMAFIAGLFYDVGQLVLSICIPDQFAEILKQQQASGAGLFEVEHQMLGYDHAAVGAECEKRRTLCHAPRRTKKALDDTASPECFRVAHGSVNLAHSEKSHKFRLTCSMPLRRIAIAKFAINIVHICRVLSCRLFLVVFNRNLLGDRRS